MPAWPLAVDVDEAGDVAGKVALGIDAMLGSAELDARQAELEDRLLLLGRDPVLDPGEAARGARTGAAARRHRPRAGSPRGAARPRPCRRAATGRHARPEPAGWSRAPRRCGRRCRRGWRVAGVARRRSSPRRLAGPSACQPTMSSRRRPMLRNASANKAPTTRSRARPLTRAGATLRVAGSSGRMAISQARGRDRSSARTAWRGARPQPPRAGWPASAPCDHCSCSQSGSCDGAGEPAAAGLDHAELAGLQDEPVGPDQIFEIGAGGLYGPTLLLDPGLGRQPDRARGRARRI